MIRTLLDSKVVICSCVQVDDERCRDWKARRVFVDASNRPRD